ncbi:MAG: hypothetical protein COS99_03855 [Candidatus Omnitrophica bacterium CG07_land_8_20_14_0_80_42_15]|uniref:DUF4015 domain-containing protein n=1 Tax=Candidatus Aquitaenariimonas noxiae TaxID=1974741 RepID=A0A2J0L0S1_9BACT|nr:MAG: hypothetical protein COS99_03855 [Candidatus Omnitrophica bacterium CG07_land_8_20_14_0_80_42_15]
MKTGVSYFARSRLKHMQEDMEEIKRNNCNFVVHTFSEQDLEFYKGTIQKLVEISKIAGLEVWLDPWGVGGVFGGESYSQFVSKNLDARQISAEGNSIPAACFNNDKFRSFMQKWIDAAVEIGANNIFWDEPHFYIFEENVEEKIGTTKWSCRCDSCAALFKKKYGYEIPKEMNKDIQDFKEFSVANFIEQMSSYAAKSNVKNSFCFLPLEGHVGGIRNWSAIAKIRTLDIIGTDPYWPTSRSVTEKEVALRVSSFSKKIKALSDEFKKEAQIWILNFRIKNGTENNVRLAVETAYKEGIRNIAAWSFYGTEMMTSLASDDPLLVWKTLGDAYKEAASREEVQKMRQ